MATRKIVKGKRRTIKRALKGGSRTSEKKRPRSKSNSKSSDASDISGLSDSSHGSSEPPKKKPVARASEAVRPTHVDLVESEGKKYLHLINDKKIMVGEMVILPDDIEDEKKFVPPLSRDYFSKGILKPGPIENGTKAFVVNVNTGRVAPIRSDHMEYITFTEDNLNAPRKAHNAKKKKSKDSQPNILRTQSA